jgi:methylglutaconyl-CoA hydratase
MSDASATDAVLLGVSGGVATITLNRPDARNRLDGEGMAQLTAHLRSTAIDPAVRIVVLTGTGSTFCAGADLAGAVAAEEGGFATGGTQALVDVLTAMLDHPKPIIGRVQGHVAGGGNGLVAACDIAVATASARFAFSEVRLGLAPAIIATVCIPRMNPRDAAELLLTGERVSAERVLRSGLVTAVAEDDALDASVNSYVQALLAGGPQALIETKDLLRRIPRMSQDEAFAWTAQMSARLFTSEEARAGMTAFLSKTTAPWVPTD